MNEPEKLVVETESSPTDRPPADLFPGRRRKDPAADRPAVPPRRRAHHGLRQHQGLGRARGPHLERAGFRVGVLSGDVPQKKRETLLEDASRRASWTCWWPPMSPRAACISMASGTCSITTCRSMPRTTCTASAAPRAWAPRATRSALPASVMRSLPEIEAYIEQKIPVEQVTEELMTALPRKPREGVEATAQDGESIGEIFKDAREQRAAEEQRRGGGRGPGGGGVAARAVAAARARVALHAARASHAIRMPNPGWWTQAMARSRIRRQPPRPTPTRLPSMASASRASAGVGAAASGSRVHLAHRRLPTPRLRHPHQRKPSQKPRTHKIARQGLPGLARAMPVAARKRRQDGRRRQPGFLAADAAGPGLRKLVKRGPRSQH